MALDLDELKNLHSEVEKDLKQYEYHIDFHRRLQLIQQSKQILVKYFKLSIALNQLLANKSGSDEHLDTTLRIYGANMHEEGKKIIATFLKYDLSTENKHRLTFQMEIAEALSLLDHRIRSEKKFLIPEYRRLIQEQGSNTNS